MHLVVEQHDSAFVWPVAEHAGHQGKQ